MEKSKPTGKGFAPLNDEERAAALEKAAEVRAKRAALKSKVKAGLLSFTDAMEEPDAERITVRSLLICVPGIGGAKADNIMGTLRIMENRRVKGLGCRQKAQLIELEKNGWKL